MTSRRSCETGTSGPADQMICQFESALSCCTAGCVVKMLTAKEMNRNELKSC